MCLYMMCMHTHTHSHTHTHTPSLSLSLIHTHSYTPCQLDTTGDPTQAHVHLTHHPLPNLGEYMCECVIYNIT